MTSLSYDIFETKFGWVGVIASEKGLRRSTLPNDSPEACASRLGPELGKAEHRPEAVADIRQKLIAYFDGEPVSFDDESVDWEGAGEFYKAAWSACRSIPEGETRTYQWLAAQAGSPNAPRAAGQSMANNRLPVIVPCHRVIAKDGSLRGFGEGASRLDLKQQMLDLESATPV